MTDQANLTEWREERAGILEFDAGLPRAEAEATADTMSEDYRHACEVRSVVRMYREQGGAAVKGYLAEVAKKRGQESADKLRRDALKGIGL